MSWVSPKLRWWPPGNWSAASARRWMAQLIDMECGRAERDVKKSIGAHEGSVDGLRRKLQQRIERLSFVVRDLGQACRTGIDDMISALEAGRNVVLQFGQATRRCWPICWSPT